MPTTPAGERVYKVVNDWMSSRPQFRGWWNVFEGSRSFDIIVSVRGQRLTLVDEQAAPTIKPEVEERILNWLNDLAQQLTTT